MHHLAKMAFLQTLVSSLVDLIVVSGVVWPYYPQAQAILKSKDASAFSTNVSLVLIVSATLRVFFWIGKRFGTALLVQAIASILAQFGMLWVVLKVQNENARSMSSGAALAARRHKDKTFLDFKMEDFWAWNDWESYALAQACFLVTMMLFTGLVYPAAWYTEVLGTLSLGIEALLPLPQALANYKRGSTEGLSTVLIGSWVVGDAFKTIYAFSKGEPMQFVMCGAFQLCVDLVITYQMLNYGKGVDAGKVGSHAVNMPGVGSRSGSDVATSLPSAGHSSSLSGDGNVSDGAARRGQAAARRATPRGEL